MLTPPPASQTSSGFGREELERGATSAPLYFTLIQPITPNWQNLPCSTAPGPIYPVQGLELCHFRPRPDPAAPGTGTCPSALLHPPTSATCPSCPSSADPPGTATVCRSQPPLCLPALTSLLSICTATWPLPCWHLVTISRHCQPAALSLLLRRPRHHPAGALSLSLWWCCWRPAGTQESQPRQPRHRATDALSSPSCHQPPGAVLLPPQWHCQHTRGVLPPQMRQPHHCPTHTYPVPLHCQPHA